MKRKLLFIVNVDWFFISHRLSIGLAAQKAGYEVHLACQVTSKREELVNHGFILHDLPLSRGGLNVFSELRSYLVMRRTVKSIDPDIVHLITIKPSIYGGIISRFLKIKRVVTSISGLGFVFTNEGMKAKITRFFVTKLYKLALSGSVNKVIFQNSDDRRILEKLGAIRPDQVIMIRGSGVDLKHYCYYPEQSGEVTAILPARLLRDKGVFEFVEAAKIIKDQEIKIRMALVGDVDLYNASSVTSDDLSKVSAPKNIALLNRVYNEGDQSYSKKIDGRKIDLLDYRWKKNDSEKQKTSTSSFAWTVLLELTLSSIFEN
jgi:glycosyltransferase involved in cell wall biosynthesis